MQKAKTNAKVLSEAEVELMASCKKMYKEHKDLAKQSLQLKEDALAKIDQILKENENHSIRDFQFLLDTIDMVEVAHQALANSYVLKYYKKPSDILLSVIIDNIEKQLFEFKKQVDSSWH